MSRIKARLIKKLESLRADIGIVGLGYVGLPLSIRFTLAGYKVTGFDADEEKVRRLAAGASYIGHIENNLIADCLEKGFTPTADFSLAYQMDAVILCVPTPLTEERLPDLSFIRSSMDSICPHLKEGQIISLESTTYPGTTEEEIAARVSDAGFKPGESVFIVYSPEREDPGRKSYDARTIPKLCGGHTPDCLEVGLALYGRAIDTLIPMTSTGAAEMTKILENIYRSVNIAMVNEMKMVADKMGIDIHEVIAAAGTKPFGFTPFYPGPGLGGHCLPIDPYYLSWKARQHGADSRLAELAGEINAAMPQWIIEKAAGAIESRGGRIHQSRFLILGIAYKKNIDDTRESPAAVIMDMLVKRGAEAAYCDPYVPVFPKMRKHSFNLKSQSLSKETLQNADAVIIVTDHDCFDYALIAAHGKLIIDTRGRYAGQPGANIIPA